MSKFTTFGVALLVSVFLVIFFSFFGDGDPSEAASIIIQAFWLIATLIKVIFSIIVVFATAFLFVLLSFIMGAINFFLEAFNQSKLSTTYLLDMQEDALDAVEVFYQGLISFLVYFQGLVEEAFDVTIDWNPEQTLGTSVTIIGGQGLGLLGNAADTMFEAFDLIWEFVFTAPVIFIDHIWTSGVDILHGTIDHIAVFIQDTAVHIINVGQDGFDHVVNVGQDGLDHLVNVVEDLPAAGQWVIDNGQEFIQHGVNVVQDAGDWAIDVAQDTAVHAVNVVQDTAEHGVNVVQDTAQHGVNVTHDTIDHGANVVQDVFCFFAGC